MADDKKLKFTQAEVDEMIAEHAETIEDAKEEARSEGYADGIIHASEFIKNRADDLDKADEGKGWLEAEIAILKWAARRVGSL